MAADRAASVAVALVEPIGRTTPAPVVADARPLTPWRTVSEAAARAQVSKKTIYHAVASGQLRAARVGGKRALRFRDEFIDAWLEATVEPREIRR